MGRRAHLCGRRGAALVVVVLLVLVAGAQSAAAVPRVFSSSFGSFSSPEALAVDPASHAVYVLNRGDGSVDRFDSDGEALDFSAVAPYATGNQLTGTPEGPFSFFGGSSENQIAVAPPTAGAGTAGNLYVTDANGTAVDVFDSNGAFAGRITEAGGGSLGLACGVAVDPAGAIYVADYLAGAIYRYVPSSSTPGNADFDSQITGVATPCSLAASSSSVYASTWSSGPLTAYPNSLFPGGGNAFDASFSGTVIEAGDGPVNANAVYVDATSDTLHIDEGDRVAVFDGSGAFLEYIASEPALIGSWGVAVDGTSETVYVADTEVGKVNVYAVPEPGPPAVSSTNSSSVTSTEARLEARINPNSAATTFHFEYVADAQYQADGFDSATKVPIADTSIGEGFTAVSVSRVVKGLQPGTSYHFRVAATNSFAAVEGTERTFTTYLLPGTGSCSNATLRTGLSAALPNCRAYELVTPVVKDYGYGGLPGQPIQPASLASSRGGSVIYNAGGPLPGATAGPFLSLYSAIRSLEGWQGKSISPPQAPVASLGGVYPNFLGFKPDISKGLVVSANPSLTAEAVPKKPNLYVQTIDPLSWSLLTPVGTEIATGFVEFLGASADFGYVYYGTTTPQTEEAPEEVGDTHSQVYGMTNGVLYLAGILPDGSVAPQAIAPRPVSATGSGSHVSHMVSADGTRVLFREGAFSTLASPLYLRVNADQVQAPIGVDCRETSLACTVEVSASQKTDGDGPGGIDPNGPKPAVFQEASADLSRILFTSQSELTDDANTGRNGGGESTDAGNDLYMYNWETAELTDLTVDANPADEQTGANVLGVLGASEDAAFVYFAATGDLTGDAESGAANLYLWHEGDISFIGALDPTVDDGNWATTANQLTARVTLDGGSIAFTSVRSLTGYDNEDAVTGEADSQVYLYKAGGEVSCVSCNPSESNPVGPSRITPGSSGSGYNPSRNISDDGRRVFFDSRDALVPRDTNGRQDVYMYEGGTVYLISAGRGSTNARFGDASPTGDDAFFGTEERLLPQDQDVLPDLYDARVNGGFAATDAVAPCNGEACRPLGVAPPSQAPIGSSAFVGPGNRKHRKHHKERHKKKHKKHRRGERGHSHRGRG